MHRAEAEWDGLALSPRGWLHLQGGAHPSVVHPSWTPPSPIATGMECACHVAEFECAARGGPEGPRRARGDEFISCGVHQASLWQGTLAHHDRDLDGFRGHGPVKPFHANGYGLYDMQGNVWEESLTDTPELLPPLPAGLTAGSPLLGPEGPTRRKPALFPELLLGLPRGGAPGDRSRLRPEQPRIPLPDRRFVTRWEPAPLPSTACPANAATRTARCPPPATANWPRIHPLQLRSGKELGIVQGPVGHKRRLRTVRPVSPPDPPIRPPLHLPAA